MHCVLKASLPTSHTEEEKVFYINTSLCSLPWNLHYMGQERSLFVSKKKNRRNVSKVNNPGPQADLMPSGLSRNLSESF